MAKALLTLPDGTIVNIEGDPAEIAKILSLHRPGESTARPSGKIGQTKRKKAPRKNPIQEQLGAPSGQVDLAEIVTTIKNCDESEIIEKSILDRSSQVDRVLLPLYITHKYFKDSVKLTTGDIGKILSELGISILQPNVAKTLSSTAAKYVIGDQMRRKGQPVKYKLSRRGEQYLSSVIQEKSND